MNYNLIGTWKAVRKTTYGESTEASISVNVGQTFRVIEALEGDMVLIEKGDTITETVVGTLQLSAKKISE